MLNKILLEEIEQYMDKREWNKTELAMRTGIHLSEISRILNQKQSLSIKNMDLITRALALPEGALYQYYIEECFNDSRTLDRRKSMQFLYRCAVIDNEQFHILLDTVLEEMSKTIRNKNCTIIFSVAEQLLEDGMKKRALILYEFIIENMPDHFSQEVAISYYRRFYILRLTKEGKYAQAQMLEHIDFMPEDFQVLSYIWITATAYVQRRWKETLHYAIKLEKIAKTEEHYGRALLYQSLALTCLGSPLEEILSLIDRYEKINDYYADIAIGNRYCAYLDFGQFQYVDDYFSWLEDRNDIVFGLPRVLEAYVRTSRFEDVEQLLKRFQPTIKRWSKCENPYHLQMYLRFRHAYALYLFKRKRFSEGLHEMLDIASRSKQIGNLDRFNQSLLIYWQYRDHASLEHDKVYTRLLETENMSKLP